MPSSENTNALSECEQFHNFISSVNDGQPVSEVDPTELRRFDERLVEQAPY